MLVWEVVAYAETPHDDLQSSDIIEMAGNGTLKLKRYSQTIDCVVT